VIPQGRYITAARAVLGLSRAELAGLAKVSISTLHAWETAKHSPVHNNRKAVLNVLEARGIGFLFNGAIIVGLTWPPGEA
jgi:DNA-binding transcriptional regulator YiaG